MIIELNMLPDHENKSVKGATLIKDVPKCAPIDSEEIKLDDLVNLSNSSNVSRIGHFNRVRLLYEYAVYMSKMST